MPSNVKIKGGQVHQSKKLVTFYACLSIYNLSSLCHITNKTRLKLCSVEFFGSCEEKNIYKISNLIQILLFGSQDNYESEETNL
jgi:hypothetical protein